MDALRPGGSEAGQLAGVAGAAGVVVLDAALAGRRTDAVPQSVP